MKLWLTRDKGGPLNNRIRLWKTKPVKSEIDNYGHFFIKYIGGVPSKQCFEISDFAHIMGFYLAQGDCIPVEMSICEK